MRLVHSMTIQGHLRHLRACLYFQFQLPDECLSHLPTSVCIISLVGITIHSCLPLHAWLYPWHFFHHVPKYFCLTSLSKAFYHSYFRFLSFPIWFVEFFCLSPLSLNVTGISWEIETCAAILLCCAQWLLVFAGREHSLTWYAVLQVPCQVLIHSRNMKLILLCPSCVVSSLCIFAHLLGTIREVALLFVSSVSCSHCWLLSWLDWILLSTSFLTSISIIIYGATSALNCDLLGARTSPVLLCVWLENKA